MAVVDYIYGIDIASRSKKTAWVKIDHKGFVVDGGFGLGKLPAILSNDLKNEKLKIAIGIEAVMWFPAPVIDKQTGAFQMHGRFPEEKGGYVCHSGLASSTSVKTLLLQPSIFRNKTILRNHATKNVDRFKTDPRYRVLLYEGFGAGTYKPKPESNYKMFHTPVLSASKTAYTLNGEDDVDAFVIASALLYDLVPGRLNPKLPMKPICFLKVEYDPASQNVIQHHAGKKLTRSHVNGYYCLWETILGRPFSATEPAVCNVCGIEWDQQSLTIKRSTGAR